MDLIQQTHRASRFEPEDFISNMPDNVIGFIMDRLPLQDAVRTSILSRNWRYKWTMLSRIVFDDKFFKYLFKKGGENKFGIITSTFVLHLKGVIKNFVLCIDESRYSVNVEEISRWFSFLSTKGVKYLTLEKKRDANTTLLNLPAHLFSCSKLKHLKLSYCNFDPPTSFQGFANLLSLDLQRVQFESGKIAWFFTQCPVLNSLNLSFTYSSWKVKPTDIAKLSKLKILSLFLCNLDNDSSCSIFELVDILPQLRQLNLDFCNSKLVEGVAKMKFPTTFSNLETLKISRIDLGNDIMLSCFVEMMRSFSNLQTLKISESQDTITTHGIRFPEVGSNTMRPLQLQNLLFYYFKASDEEVCLIKYLLTCSPSLKKVVIYLHSNLVSIERSRFTRKLLKLQRAYPVVYFDLY